MNIPCRRCEGTGNELLAMYCRCSACGGTGAVDALEVAVSLLLRVKGVLGNVQPLRKDVEAFLAVTTRD